MNAYPYVVDVSSTLSCGGTLISPKWVVTAAHCVASHQFATVKYLRADPQTGATVEKGSQTSYEVVKHDLYSNSSPDEYDIALIHLPAEFSPDPLLQPARLPRGPRFVGQSGILVHGVPSPGQLSVYVGGITLGPANGDFIVKSPVSSLCLGDSGSGFMGYSNGEFVALGIASSSAGGGSCTHPAQEALMTDVASYGDWIRSVTGLPAPAVAPTADVLWRESNTGEVKVWLMDGSVMTSQATVTGPGVTGMEWQVQALGDCNADGQSDILWRNTTSGEVKLWLMNGATISSATTLSAPGVVGPEWQIQGMGDFDHDGKSDILWRNTTSGEVKLWLMNGNSIASIATVTGPGVVELSWQVQAVGDFNGDLKSDILWRNGTSSEVKVWLMNGSSIASTNVVTAAGVVELNWQIQGVGDLDADGKSDILWRHTSGEVKAWLMNGGTILSATTLTGPGVVGLGWQIHAIGDFDGSGTSDLLWRDTSTGEVKEWLMNGAAIGAQVSVTAPGAIGLWWQIEGAGAFGP